MREKYKIKKIVDIINGYSFKSELYTDKGINVIRITNVDDGNINNNNLRFYSSEYEKEIGNAMLKENDILMSLTGNVGIVGIVKKDILPAGLNQRVACLRTKNEKVIYKFLYYYFQTNQYREKATLNAQGIAQLNLSTEWIGNDEIYIPSINEQNKIASFLDKKVSEIDTVIEKTKETIEDYKKYKQSIITEVVTKGLNKNVEMKDSGIEWIGYVPKHWKMMKIRNLGDLQNGISAGAEKFGTGYSFANYGDIYNNYELPQELSGLIKSTDKDREVYSIKRGDIFFTRTSETIEEIGFSCACVKSIDDACFSGFVIRFRPYDKMCMLPEFYKYYFRSEIHRKYFVKEMNIVTRASLGQELLKSMPILIPSEIEQQRIAEYLERKCNGFDNIIKSKEKIIEELEQYKKSLIYEYVTGKKEVI